MYIIHVYTYVYMAIYCLLATYTTRDAPPSCHRNPKKAVLLPAHHRLLPTDLEGFRGVNPGGKAEI